MGRGRAVDEGASYVARSIESEEDLRNVVSSLRAMEGTLYKLSDNLKRAGEVKRQDSLEKNIKTLNDGIKDLTSMAITRKGERIDEKEIQRLFGKAVSGMLKDIQSSSPIIDKKHISHGLDISPQDMDVLRKKFLNFISTTFTYLPHYKSSKPSAGFGADNELADDYNKLMDELISLKEREVKQADKAKALEEIELGKTKRLIKAKTEQTEAIEEETKEINKVGRRRKLGSEPLTPEQQSANERRAKNHEVAVKKEKANQRSISIQNAVVRLNMNNIKRAEEGAEEILSNMSQNKKPLNSFIHGMQRAMLRYANDEDKEELQAQSPYGQTMLKRLIPGIVKLSGAGPTDEDLASSYLYKNSKTGAEVKLPYSLQTAIDVINGKIQEVVSSVEDVVEKQEEVVKAVQESTTVMERVVSKDGKFEKVDGNWRRIQREDGKQPPTLAEAQGAMMQAIGAMLQAPTTKGVVDSSSQIVSSAVSAPISPTRKADDLVQTPLVNRDIIRQPLGHIAREGGTPSTPSSFALTPFSSQMPSVFNLKPPSLTQTPDSQLSPSARIIKQNQIAKNQQLVAQIRGGIPAGAQYNQLAGTNNAIYQQVAKNWGIAPPQPPPATPSRWDRFKSWSSDKIDKTGAMVGKATSLGDTMAGGSLGEMIAGKSKLGKGLWNLSEKASEGGQMGASKILGKMAVGVGIIVMLMKKLVDSSPMLKAVVDLLNLGVTLFFLPIGNAIAQTILPAIQTFVENMIKWNIFFNNWPDSLYIAFDSFVTDFIENIKEIILQVKLVPENVSNWVDETKEMGGGSITNGLGVRVSNWASRAVENSTRVDGSFWKTWLEGDNTMYKPYSPFKLSGYAEGGYVPARPGGTPIIVGEGGKGEYIVPEGSAIRGTGGSNIVVNISGNVYGVNDLERTIKNAVDDSLNRARYR